MMFRRALIPLPPRIVTQMMFRRALIPLLCLSTSLTPSHAGEEPVEDLVGELIHKAPDLVSRGNDSAAGQWFAVLVDAGRLDPALEVARRCRLAQSRCWGWPRSPAPWQRPETSIARGLSPPKPWPPAGTEVQDRRTAAIARAAAALHHAGREEERDAALLEVETGLAGIENRFGRAGCPTAPASSTTTGGRRTCGSPPSSGVTAEPRTPTG